MSSSNSPCAACKYLRRKCTQECVFAPYFPPEQPQRFANVHKVFGASNVSKLLKDLAVDLREDAVNSLAYEAHARLRDPVYGCVGMISLLQQKLKQVQSDLYGAKQELGTYIGPQAMMPVLQAQGFMPQQHLGSPLSSTVIQHGMMPMMGIPTGSSHSEQLVIRDAQHQHQPHHHHHQQQQQMFEAQQLAAALAAREQQETLRDYEQRQQQQLVSWVDAPTGTVTPSGFNQMSDVEMSPCLALGGFDNAYQIQSQQQPENQYHYDHAANPLETQLLLSSQQQEQTPPPHQQPEHQYHYDQAANPLETQLFLSSQQQEQTAPPQQQPEHQYRRHHAAHPLQTQFFLQSQQEQTLPPQQRPEHQYHHHDAAHPLETQLFLPSQQEQTPPPQQQPEHQYHHQHAAHPLQAQIFFQSKQEQTPPPPQQPPTQTQQQQNSEGD